jgi:hypothetical protein
MSMVDRGSDGRGPETVLYIFRQHRHVIEKDIVISMVLAGLIILAGVYLSFIAKMGVIGYLTFVGVIIPIGYLIWAFSGLEEFYITTHRFIKKDKANHLIDVPLSKIKDVHVFVAGKGELRGDVELITDADYGERLFLSNEGTYGHIICKVMMQPDRFRDVLAEATEKAKASETK